MTEAATAERSAGWGDFHGRPTRRMTNESIWLEALAEVGPRLVRLGRHGSSANILAETPDAGWDTPNGRFELFGGHRLWFAPEDPERVAVPDGTGLHLPLAENALHLGGRVEPSGVARSMEIRLASDGCKLEVRHVLRNAGTRPVELAAWAITQLPLGGSVVLPEETARAEHGVRPNRHLALWPYTSREDERFVTRDGRLTVDARPGSDFKVGYFNSVGWVGYVRDGTMLVRRFQPEAVGRYSDMNCNVEVFVGDRFVELEVLGPLVMLEPNAAVVHAERWELVGILGDTDPVAAASPAAQSVGARGPVGLQLRP